MKKYLIALLLLVFIVPSVALASWWNPFTWKIFKKSPEVKIEQTIPVSNVPINISTDIKKEESPKISETDQKIKKETTPISLYDSKESSWKAVEDYNFPLADQKGWVSLKLHNSALNEDRYYRKEDSNWVLKNNESEANQPYKLNTSPAVDLYAKYRDPVTGKILTPEEYADMMANKAKQQALINQYNDVITGTTDPSKSASQSGIQYTPEQLDSIESANAQIYKIGIDPENYKYLYQKPVNNLSGIKGTVILSNSSCNYYIVETSSGYSLLEWYSGPSQSKGNIIYGDLNSYGMKDITNSNYSKGRVYIHDTMLSKLNATEKYNNKCN